MPGEKNLHKLIKNIKPVLNAGQYVFCKADNTIQIPPDKIQCIFREAEGVTLILHRENADAYGLHYNFVASWITLTVHSSLEAVGLTARVSNALAKAGISCNAVAAYNHDHLFVPYRQSDKAMAILRNL